MTEVTERGDKEGWTIRGRCGKEAKRPLLPRGCGTEMLLIL